MRSFINGFLVGVIIVLLLIYWVKTTFPVPLH